MRARLFHSLHNSCPNFRLAQEQGKKTFVKEQKGGRKVSLEAFVSEDACLRIFTAHLGVPLLMAMSARVYVVGGILLEVSSEITDRSLKYSR